MYSYKINIPSNEFDEMAKKHMYASIYQDSAWGKVKKDWNLFNIAIYRDSELVGGSYVLERNVIGHYTLGYMTRGPLIDFDNEEEVACFFDGLHELAKKQHMISVKFDPNIYGTYSIDQTKEAMEYRNEKIVSLLKKYNCQHLGYTLDLYAATQPRMQVAMPACDDVTSLFPKKTKDKLKIANKHHIEIKPVDVSGAKEFSELIALTEARKGIMLRDKAYFENMMRAYPKNSILLFAYANLKEMAIELEEKRFSLQQKLEELDEKAVNKKEEIKKQLEKNLLEQKQIALYREEDGDYPLITGLLLVWDKKNCELLYSGLNGKYRKFYGAYLLRQKAMEYAFSQGCEEFDFGGVENTFDGGLFEFKSSFHPNIRTYIGEFDYIHKPFLFKLMNAGIHYTKIIKLAIAKKGKK